MPREQHSGRSWMGAARQVIGGAWQFLFPTIDLERIMEKDRQTYLAALDAGLKEIWYELGSLEDDPVVPCPVGGREGLDLWRGTRARVGAGATHGTLNQSANENRIPRHGGVQSAQADSVPRRHCALHGWELLPFIGTSVQRLSYDDDVPPIEALVL